MAEIKILDEATIDKIAAGEVVERPASVVKELVENAMDAGADALTVEIKEGGVSLIRVTDNGCGLPASQVPKAFLRHATSKIRRVEDLLAIKSLGFRGEALSSIAAVAQVEMITKEKDCLTASRYEIEGSREKRLEEVGAPDGTTMLVRNLFYNTPARRKFLKTPQTEGSYVTDLMEHMALSRPEISFKYVLNGQIKFHTSGNGDLKEIIYRIYGRDVAKELVPIDRTLNGMRLLGYLGKPAINRANRNFENYFVNQRYVKSQIISSAAEEGYKAYLMQHKYPFFVLHFAFPPEKLDVNVHPAKMELRFANQPEVYEFVRDSIQETLRQTEMIPALRLQGNAEADEASKTGAKALSSPEPFETRRRVLEEEGVYCSGRKEEAGEKAQEVLWDEDAPQIASPEGKAASEEGGQLLQPESEQGVQSATGTDRILQEPLQNPMLNRIIGSFPGDSREKNDKMPANVIKSSQHILVEKPMQMNLFDEKIVSRNVRAEYDILGQVFQTYWLVAFRDKLLIIDQHAAHEKVKYERLCRRLREKECLSQHVNPPIIVTLSGKEEAAYREYADHLARLGFEVESFGGREYAIRSVPVDLFGCSEKALFEALVDELTDSPVKGTPEAVEEKLASMACKSAVKGNHTMSRREAEALIDELMGLENPYHCPHGRPTIISMSRYELEKKFSRIV